MTNLICFTDGGYDNVNKSDGYGSFKIIDESGEETILRLVYDDVNSSNQAEYKTFIELLKYLLKEYPLDTGLAIYSDSRLLVSQVTGVWEVKSENIRPLYDIASMLFSKFNNKTFNWVSRKLIVKQLGH